ncbi:hypothetical protein P8452_75196 [Trifolium repens]|nr:hypothetical protein P8452_75196 [Trifolium repens]
MTLSQLGCKKSSSHARRQTRWHSRRRRMGLWTMTEGSMRIVKDGEAHLIAIVICLQLSHDSHYIMHILKLRIIPIMKINVKLMLIINMQHIKQIY